MRFLLAVGGGLTGMAVVWIALLTGVEFLQFIGEFDRGDLAVSLLMCLSLFLTFMVIFARRVSKAESKELAPQR